VVDGLTPVMPSGAFYMMVGIELSKFPHINTTKKFMKKLMSEESVFILPGEVSDKLLCYSLLQHVCVVFPISRLYQAGVATTK